MDSREIRQRIMREHWLVAAEVGSRKDLEKALDLHADLAMLYHTARLGISKIGGLLPFGNVNDIVFQMVNDLRPKELTIPVFAGLCGTEPFRIRDLMVQQIRDIGVVGVQNFPTVGIVDGTFRENLEAVKQGFEKECILIKKSQEASLIGLPIVFNTSEALAMAKAGAEFLVLHAGPHAEAEGFSMTKKAFRKHWDGFEIIGREVKSRFPDVKLMVYTENDRNREMIEKNLMEETAIDGGYNSISFL